MKYIAVIPARYASTRFPGKPLAMLGGRPVIEHVWRRAASILGPDNVFVATDDDRIAAAVNAFGGNAVMTSSSHRSGTDRVAQAVDTLNTAPDVVINIQGDEPFVHPSQIESLMGCFNRPEVQIATLVRPWHPGSGESLDDPNLVKAVTALNGDALYFSRYPIPYTRSGEPDSLTRYTHVGIYAYRADTLRQIVRLPQSPLELTESLEQLRWLQNGYRIATAVTDRPTVGIDTPADLERAEAKLDEYSQL